jgi:Na+/proline symporter
MITNWLYNNPSWLVGAVIVGGTVLVSCLGLLVFHRLVDHNVRREHNDMVGATMGVVGTVAALLLAFIGVVTWQTFTDAEAIADTEAGAVGNLYFDSYGVPEDVREPIRNDIKNYLHIVIDQEWPKQEQGKLDHSATLAGLDELIQINRELAAFNPQNLGEANIHAEMFKMLNALFVARRNRLQAADGHVPPVVWAIILLGTTVTIVYTYFFGPRSLAMHVALTALVAASLALVVLLIALMDYPFRGQVSIDTGSYEIVRSLINSPPQQK